MSVLAFAKIDEIVFYPILVRKNLLFFKITSLSQLYNYLFVSYTYSVFNEHFAWDFRPMVEMMVILVVIRSRE